MASFTEQLSQAKRKAQLSGRPISKQEVSGIAAADQATATTRLNQAKQIATREEEVDQQKTLQATELKATADRQAERIEAEKAAQAAQLAQQKEIEAARLEEQKRVTGLEVAAAEKADKRATQQAQAGTAAGTAGAAIGFSVASVPGAAIGYVIGSTIGAAAGGSYLCTAANKTVGLTRENNRALLRFRHYVNVNHKSVLGFYLEIGPELVKAIDGDKGFYNSLKEKMIMPIIFHSESSHQEQAFWIYRTWITRLIKKYTPQHLKRGLEIVRNDKKRFKEAA